MHVAGPAAHRPPPPQRPAAHSRPRRAHARAGKEPGRASVPPRRVGVPVATRPRGRWALPLSGFGHPGRWMVVSCCCGFNLRPPSRVFCCRSCIVEVVNALWTPALSWISASKTFPPRPRLTFPFPGQRSRGRRPPRSRSPAPRRFLLWGVLFSLRRIKGLRFFPSLSFRHFSAFKF